MKLKTIFLTGTLIGLTSTGVLAAEILSLKDFLKQELLAAGKLSTEKFNLTADQTAKLKKVVETADDTSFTFYFARSPDGQLKKSCTTINQLGKEGPMQVGACFDPFGLITAVKILSHQEERGKQIEEDSFLKQFTGKKTSDAYIVGKDVDGITGATWSSKAVAEALRRSTFAFETFVKTKETK